MKNKKLIIILIVVIIVAAAGVVIFMQMNADKPDESTLPAKLAYYPTGDYLVTNLKDENALVKVTVVLGIDPENAEEATKYLTENNVAIRDMIVYIMRGHSKADFVDPTSLDALSQEICQAVNQMLNIDYVNRAYFNDFVIQ